MSSARYAIKIHFGNAADNEYTLYYDMNYNGSHSDQDINKLEKNVSIDHVFGRGSCHLSHSIIQFANEDQILQFEAALVSKQFKLATEIFNNTHCPDYAILEVLKKAIECDEKAAAQPQLSWPSSLWIKKVDLVQVTYNPLMITSTNALKV